MKRCRTITSNVYAGLISSTAVTEGVLIAAFASDFGLRFRIAFSGTR